jgi:hypothetical protein
VTHLSDTPKKSPQKKSDNTPQKIVIIVTQAIQLFPNKRSKNNNNTTTKMQ